MFFKFQEPPSPQQLKSYKFKLQGTAGLNEAHIGGYFSQFGSVLDVIDEVHQGYVEIDGLSSSEAEKLLGTHVIEGITIAVEFANVPEAKEMARKLDDKSDEVVCIAEAEKVTVTPQVQVRQFVTTQLNPT